MCRLEWDLLIRAVTEKVFNICMNSNYVLHKFSLLSFLNRDTIMPFCDLLIWLKSCFSSKG